MNKTGALCPICNGDLVERKTKQKKRIFYGCSNYPTCNFAMWERPVPEPCPNCGGLMVVPRVGQEPVCYNEMVQRGGEEKPQQDGATPVRSTRKKTATAEAVKPKTTRRTATRSRKKSAGTVRSTRASKTT